MPGVRARATDGVVAEVNRHPKNPSILGLQNLSVGAWKATLNDGRECEIATGQSVRLDPGTMINFGGLTGEIRQ